ncbi:MAG: hypothetical protein H7834_07930 [Magnetococcus sp. YQC-9]
MDMTDLPDLLFREPPDNWDEAELLAPADPTHEPSLAAVFLSTTSPGNLAEVMEDLAAWLAPRIPVELLAYWNPRQRKSHLLAIAPGDGAERLATLVQGVIDGPLPRIRHWRRGEWFFHLWMGAPLDGWDRLLIVEKAGALAADTCNALIQDATQTFGPALHHAGQAV